MLDFTARVYAILNMPHTADVSLTENIKASCRTESTLRIHT